MNTTTTPAPAGPTTRVVVTALPDDRPGRWLVSSTEPTNAGLAAGPSWTVEDTPVGILDLPAAAVLVHLTRAYAGRRIVRLEVDEHETTSIQVDLGEPDGRAYVAILADR